MPWNGSGTFTGIYNWSDDKANGIKIRADRHTEQDNTFIAGINNCIAKDGQNTPTANLPMATYKHTNIADATERNEYLSMGQFQDNEGKYYVTTGSSNAYVVTPTPAITAYVAGLSFYINPNFSNTGAATLNVSGLGTKAITKLGTTALASGDIVSGQIYEVIYDGTQFQLIDSNFITLTGDVTGTGSGSIATTIATDAVETSMILNSNVTLAKIQDISTDKILGRTTASSGVVEQLDFLDEDDMFSDSDTAIATQQSIKAYVDAAIANLSSNGQIASAWCTFDGTASTPISIDDGYNVTNVTKNGSGDYTINFTSALSSANYAVSAIGAQGTMAGISTTTAPSTSAVRVTFKTDDGGLTDGAHICVTIFSKE